MSWWISSQNTTFSYENDEIPIFDYTCTRKINALTTADAVLRALLTQITPVDEKLTMDSDIYVSAFLQNLPVTDKCIAEIQKAQEQNPEFEAVEQTC